MKRNLFQLNNCNDYIFSYEQKAYYFFASLIEKIKQKNIVPDTSSHIKKNQFPFCILLADDDSDDRSIFKEAVATIDSNISVVSIENGLQLMEKINNPDFPLPEIIFLDLNMPGKSGKECLKEIRQNEEYKNVPVVIYSTSSNMKDISETHSIGANLYVRKPSSFSSILNVINKTFSVDWAIFQRDKHMKNFVL